MAALFLLALMRVKFVKCQFSDLYRIVSLLQSHFQA
jgi:hypothetical protein